MVTPILPLRVEDAEVRKGGQRLLGPVTLEIAPEGCTVIIGPNGAGKTTLLRMLHGLDRARGGRVQWNVTKDQAFKAQSFVFQSPILMRRSVIDNIAFPLITRGMKRAEARLAAMEWAERVGLGAFAEKRARTLSGGERQKMALARALVIKPQLLFLDEPCSNLDGRTTRDIETVLAEVRAAGTRIVMTTHDMGQARRLAEDVILLHKGQIVESAPAKAFFKGPATTQGQAFLNGDILE